MRRRKRYFENRLVLSCGELNPGLLHETQECSPLHHPEIFMRLGREIKTVLWINVPISPILNYPRLRQLIFGIRAYLLLKDLNLDQTKIKHGHKKFDRNLYWDGKEMISVEFLLNTYEGLAYDTESHCNIYDYSTNLKRDMKKHISSVHEVKSSLESLVIYIRTLNSKKANWNCIKIQFMH